MTDNAKIASSATDINADSDAVWDAITTNEGLAAWMGEGATIEAELDGDISVPDIVTGRPRTGRVDDIEAGSRIGFVWWPDDDPSDRSRVEITLAPNEDGLTTVEVIEIAPRMRLVDGSAAVAWAWRGAIASVSCSLVRQ